MMENSSTNSSTMMRLNLTLTSSQSSPRAEICIALSGTTSSMLRQKIADETKIPLSALKLIFRGRLIANKDEGDVVVDYKLEDGCVIHCMGKPVVSATNNETSTSTTSSGASVTMASTTSSTATAATVTNNAAASSGDLMGLLNVLKSNSASPATYLTAVTTLEKIVSNITSQPLEEKYRKVKKNNPAFQRRLGSIAGAGDVLKKLGFEEQNLEGVVHYVLTPSPHAWPALLQSHQQLKLAVQQAKSSSTTRPSIPTPPSTTPGNAMPPMMPGMPPMMPGMESAMQNLMSNPQQLQSMLQNPMVRSMMENDPRFANNPVLRQSIDTLTNNPQMLEQMSRMMADPGMRAQMNAMMGQQTGGMMGQPPQPSSSNNNNNNNSNNNNSGGDRDTTEEDMIAEAIARSLREQ